jgi:lipopolysaccharide transport system ATP-binding protein
VSDAVVRAQDLGKEFRLGGRKSPYKTIRETLSEPFRQPGRAVRRLFSRGAPPETFWALRDVTFDIAAGEVVGIIGRNGAGKSTLLKILSRITEPTLGEVKIRGRVRALLEVGTGFHPELTGRENILMNGAILGMRRAEILRRFDEIVAFAEVDQFVDTAVKHYSSGMYLRLAFAVAAHLEPEILIVDEVLAVGDSAFQRKCLGKMGEVASSGRTVLFVSHNLQAVSNLCGRALLLSAGRVAAEGPCADVVAAYIEHDAQATGRREEWADPETAPGNDRIRIRAVRVAAGGEDAVSGIAMDKPFRVEIDYWNLVPDTRLIVVVGLYNFEGQAVLESHSFNEPGWSSRSYPKGLFRSICRIPENLLNAGNYRVRVMFSDDRPRKLFDLPQASSFQVVDVLHRKVPWFGRYLGAVHPVLEWTSASLAPDREPSDASIVNTAPEGLWESR